MRKLVCIAVLLTASFTGFSQVGIGTTTPHASAALEIESTTLGFLPPTMDTAQRNLINTPAVGLTIYNTDDKCLNVYNGTAWLNICAGSSPVVSTLDCAGSIQTGLIVSLAPISTAVSIAVDYTGGNGNVYDVEVVNATSGGGNVTGLTATLASGTLTSGTGTVSYTITGTPSGWGRAFFNINLGGQACTISITAGILDKLYDDGTTRHQHIYSALTGGNSRVWLKHNLGAAFALEGGPDFNPIEVQVTNPNDAGRGNYYKWGNEDYGDIGTANWDGSYSESASATAYNSGSDVTPIKNLVNDPCPIGFRVPTRIEMWTEINSWDAPYSQAEAFAAPAKFVMTGGVSNGSDPTNGGITLNLTSTLVGEADGGNVYRSFAATVNHNTFDPLTPYLMYAGARSSGIPIRCIKQLSTELNYQK